MKRERLPSSNTSLENLLCILLIDEWLDVSSAQTDGLRK